MAAGRVVGALGAVLAAAIVAGAVVGTGAESTMLCRDFSDVLM
jgi:hypothetical protein